MWVSPRCSRRPRACRFPSRCATCTRLTRWIWTLAADESSPASATKKPGVGTCAPAYGIEFTPDLKNLTVATASGSIHGWSVGDWRPLWPPAQQPGGIQPMAMSPDGRILTTGGKTLCLWDVQTGKRIRELKPGAPLHGLRFSPTGDRIISGGVDGTGAIWDTSTGTLLASLKGHSAGILCVQFSPDGRRALTGSYDSTVRIWDADLVRAGAPHSLLAARLGREATPPLRHQGEISHATFTPDR